MSGRKTKKWMYAIRVYADGTFSLKTPKGRMPVQMLHLTAEKGKRPVLEILPIESEFVDTATPEAPKHGQRGEDSVEMSAAERAIRSAHLAAQSVKRPEDRRPSKTGIAPTEQAVAKEAPYPLNELQREILIDKSGLRNTSPSRLIPLSSVATAEDGTVEITIPTDDEDEGVVVSANPDEVGLFDASITVEHPEGLWRLSEPRDVREALVSLASKETILAKPAGVLTVAQVDNPAIYILDHPTGRFRIAEKFRVWYYKEKMDPEALLEAVQA